MRVASIAHQVTRGGPIAKPVTCAEWDGSSGYLADPNTILQDLVRTGSPHRRDVRCCILTEGFSNGEERPSTMRSRPMKLNPTTRLLWRFHRWLYAFSRGRIGSSFLGRRVILMRTTGRRSGTMRQVALYSFGRRGREIVVASYVGQPRNPAWYLNLQADPHPYILEGGKWVRAHARDAQGEERDRLLAEITSVDPAYREYQDRTSREIPIVILDEETTER
jgi:deazaflavin-dependent oxidoreductase (nitroreductase family)